MLNEFLDGRFNFVKIKIKNVALVKIRIPDS